MVSQALRLGVEVPSFRRAAAIFSDFTHLSLSKSTLQRLTSTYGLALDEQRCSEAEAMVRVPSQEEEVTWRAVPEPDSPVMNVSSDGALINIRDEGWKEVKTVTISAVAATVDDETGEIDVHLTNHSYRAGLWEAKAFANHVWAESCRRGLEKARQITSVNDGAPWDPEGTPGHCLDVLHPLHPNSRLVARRPTPLGHCYHRFWRRPSCGTSLG